MLKLLVPIDGSKSAERAIRHVVALGGEGRSVHVHLVTAYEEPLIVGELAAYVPLEKIDEAQRARSTALLAPALAALDAAGVPHTDEILVGPVAESIANCADARKVDAIVMGTRGMTAIGNLVMGSVATRVVHLAHVPVTLVK
jgi:nucleotide-binding universal stress UspA family protein